MPSVGVMRGAHTRGQPAALAAVAAMVAGVPPHAVLLAGPAGIGKSTLAHDLAAALLCTPAAGVDRPCRVCRACRMVAHGNHPDLHVLGPVGPGAQVVIGGADAKHRGVRDLVAELSLLPVEGGARVALVEGADRMNDDAQSALLKTLEEPPAGVTIILCADEEDRLLPTVRSRCARIRLGPVPSREIESILAEHDAADPPTAARLARLASGRPGRAIAYARAPEAVRLRAELARGLLDLIDARPAARLGALRDLTTGATDLVAALAPPPVGPDPDGQPRRGRGRGVASARAPAARRLAPGGTDATADAEPPDGTDGSAGEEGGARRAPAAERRRGAGLLIALWTDLARDIVMAAVGQPAAIRDIGLLDEINAAADVVHPTELTAFIERLDIAGERLESNVMPELLLDSLVLAWPRRTVPA